MVQPGPLMASPDKFSITIKGVGGHGASPHETVDAIMIAAQVITALQTIVSRNLKPTEAGVVTIGKLENDEGSVSCGCGSTFNGKCCKLRRRSCALIYLC